MNSRKLKILKNNVSQLYATLYQWMVKFLYYGSVPTIIFIGKINPF